MYVPNPIDTHDVTLSNDILELSMLLSKNTHETWAEQRIKDGWKYGNKRDDVLKTHPCLIPYDELSEEEKRYDINTSLETLKLILKLGFTIERRK